MRDPIAFLRQCENQSLANILSQTIFELGLEAQCTQLMQDQKHFKTLIENRELHQAEIIALLEQSLLGLNATLSELNKKQEGNGVAVPLALSPTVLMLLGDSAKNAGKLEKLILAQLGKSTGHIHHVVQHQLKHLNTVFEHLGLSTQLFSLSIGAALAIYNIATNATPDKKLENSFLAIRTACTTPMTAVNLITGALKNFMFLAFTTGLLLSIFSSYKKTKRLQLTADNIKAQSNDLLLEIEEEYKNQKLILIRAYESADNPELKLALDAMMATIVEQQQKAIDAVLNARAGASAELQAQLADIRVTMTLNIIAVPLSVIPSTRIGALVVSGAATAFSLLTHSAYTRRFQVHQGVKQDRVVYIGNRQLFKATRAHTAKMDYVTFAVLPDVADAPGSLKFLKRRVNQAYEQIKDSVEFHLHVPHSLPDINKENFSRALDKYTANIRWLQAFQTKLATIPEAKRPQIMNLEKLQATLRVQYNELKIFKPGLALQFELQANPSLDERDPVITAERLAKRLGRNIHRINRMLDVMQPGQVVLNQDDLIAELAKDHDALTKMPIAPEKIATLFHDLDTLTERLDKHRAPQKMGTPEEEVQYFAQKHKVEFAPGVLHMDPNDHRVWLSRDAFGLRKQSEIDNGVQTIINELDGKKEIVLMTSAHFSTENLHSLFDIRNARDGAKTELQFLNELLKKMGPSVKSKNIEALHEKHIKFFAELDVREQAIKDGALSGRFFARTRLGRGLKKLVNTISNLFYGRSSQSERESYRKQLVVLDHNSRHSSDADILTLLGGRNSADAKARRELYKQATPKIEESPVYQAAKQKATLAVEPAKPSEDSPSLRSRY